MTSVIAAYTFGGKWKIDDVSSYKSSFPSFLNILNLLSLEIFISLKRSIKDIKLDLNLFKLFIII